MSDEAADIHTLSGAYALDALDPAQAAAFERHLESCAECSAEIRSFNASVAVMADDAVEAPPARLRGSILSAISDVRPLPPIVAEDGTPEVELAPVIALDSRRGRKITTWFAVAAAVLGIAMAGAVWRSVTLQSQVSQLATAAADLNAVLTAPDAQTVAQSVGDARATVVMSMSEGEAVLVTSGMAPAPAGSTYQVWFVGASGTAASAGFVPDGPSSATLLTGDPASAVAVGVTVEPEGGSPQPTTTPLMVMELPTIA